MSNTIQNVKYKWSKLFAAKRYDNKDPIRLTFIEQQELLDDLDAASNSPGGAGVWKNAGRDLPTHGREFIVKYYGKLYAAETFDEAKVGDPPDITFYFNGQHHNDYHHIFYFDETPLSNNLAANDLETAVEKWMAWTKENFPKSGSKASLIHLQEEIKEVIEAMESEFPTYTSEEGVTLMEYADCMICLLTAAGKSGFTIQELYKAIQNKMEINYKRKWVLNPDNTYSHIK